MCWFHPNAYARLNEMGHLRKWPIFIANGAAKTRGLEIGRRFNMLQDVASKVPTAYITL